MAWRNRQAIVWFHGKRSLFNAQVRFSRGALDGSTGTPVTEAAAFPRESQTPRAHGFRYDASGMLACFRYDGSTDAIDTSVRVEEQTNAAQARPTLVSILNGGDGELYFVGRGGSTEPDGPTVGTSAIYGLEPYEQ